LQCMLQDVLQCVAGIYLPHEAVLGVLCCIVL